MRKTAMTHARLTPEIKAEAESILKKMGISISSAYEMFYRQIIAYGGLPFEMRIPTRETRQALEEARKGTGKKYPSVEEMFRDLGE
ncbi:MAG: type II toxin-antitoxin system RelB/DinJ family antitoxin [Deltaproteobacteria bacterium]|nr:type II toxin-antitoxin system RelB/DinJ family antitoxin [Deltaproteobacteria bacterium]